MGLNLLLLKRSFSTGWKRMALIASSVAVGVLILLSFTAIFNAMTNYDRSAWSSAIISKNYRTHDPIAGVDPIYVVNQWDSYHGQNYSIYDVQAGGAHTPELFSGIQRLPQPGEYYASPEVIRLMKEHPEQHLDKRYGTKLLGELPEAILPGRDSLMVVRGSDYPLKDGELVLTDGSPNSRQPSRTTVSAQDVANYKFVTTTAEAETRSAVYQIAKRVTYLGILILLFPVIMLVSIATRLGSVQREQRYAALRLVGTTNSQVTGIIATESAVSTLLGIAVGFLLYFVAKPLLNQISVSDYLYWPDNITITWIQALAIAGVTLVMSLFANWWGMRNVRTSPLGVVQKQKVEKRPSWWRLLPLLLGIGSYVYVVWQKINPDDTDKVIRATNLMMIGVVVIMIGLVLATPVLTYRLSQLITRLTRRPVSLIGMKYIKSHARAISRSVSGVVLALFAGSFYIIGTSGIASLNRASVVADGLSILRDDTAVVEAISPTAERQFKQDLEQRSTSVRMVQNYYQGRQLGSFITGQCLELNHYFERLDCSHGKLVGINQSMATNNPHQIVYASDQAELKQRIIEAIHQGTAVDPSVDDSELVADSGSVYLVKVPAADYEALRSTIMGYDNGVGGNSAYTKSAQEAKSPVINPIFDRLANLAYAGMAVTMAVAIVSTTISTIGGLLERRRSMYSLRLSGMQVGELKRMVMIESVIPLAVMTLVAAGLGAWCSSVVISVGSSSLKPQITPAYLAIVAGSLVIATLAIYSILPMINRLTAPSNNQTE